MADNKNVKQFKCMNFGACAKADAGEIIEIDALETLGGIPECPHCHQHTLEEVVKKPFPTKLVAGIAAAVLVLGGVGYGVSQMGGDDEKIPGTPPTDTTVVQKVDTPVVETSKSVEEKSEEAKSEPKQEQKVVEKTVIVEKPVNTGNGTKNLGYGKYVGGLKNGEPDGTGRLTYTQSHQVVDSKDIMAEPGEYIEGIFANGKPSFVTLYKNDGTVVKVKR